MNTSNAITVILLTCMR